MATEFTNDGKKAMLDILAGKLVTATMATYDAVEGTTSYETDPVTLSWATVTSDTLSIDSNHIFTIDVPSGTVTINYIVYYVGAVAQGGTDVTPVDFTVDGQFYTLTELEFTL